MRDGIGWTRRVAPLALLTLIVAGCGRDRAPKAAVGLRAPTPTQADSTAAAASASTGATGDSASTVETLPVITASATVDSGGVPLVLTLAQVGYRAGVTLLGALDEATIAIPVNSGLRPSELQLRLLPTPGMPLGTLVLRQRDRILAMRALSDTTTAVVLPLNDVVIEQGKATVTLGVTVPGRDACQAQLYYRTVIDPSSRIAFGGTASTTADIYSFFAPWLSRITFYLAEQPSLDAAQAALDAAAFAARRYRGMQTEFVIRPLPAAGATLAEPGPWERAIVWNPAGATGVIGADSLRGTVLAIGARRDARQLFSFDGGADLVASRGFRTGEIDLAGAPGPRDATVRTLSDLGFADRTVEGNTLVVADYPFALADFGDAVSPTAFRLVVKHSIMPPVGYGSVRVHLNGSLIWSKAIDRTSIDAVVALPAHLLRRDNNLQVRFQVVLSEGGCVLGNPVFTATVDASSAFVIDGSDRLAPGFGRFPSAFVPSFSVLLEPRDRYRVDLAATVIGAMQQTTRTPLAPALARDRAGATGPLLAIGTSSLADALDAPVHADGFRLRDRAGRIWDEFTPDAPYAAMQGWERNGDDVLLLHHTQSNGQPLADLLRESLAPYGWFGVRGDLMVRGVTGNVKSLTIANAGWRLEERPASPLSFYSRYRTAIFAAAIGVLLIVLVWLYPRVVRRELDPAG